MEEDKDLRNGTPDGLCATDATDATTTSSRKLDNKGLYQSMDIARQLKSETKRNHGSSFGVHKTTSRNVTKKLKAKQEAQAIIGASKNAEATIKQIATQDFQGEKFCIEEEKQKVISEVGRELQIIGMAREEAREVQR